MIKKIDVIAVDLDGTVWNDNFPDYDEPYEDAIDVINEFIDRGIEVIIWTSRDIENALKGVFMLVDKYGLNPNVKINEHANIYLGKYDKRSNKIAADVYIDDRAYGAPDFSEKGAWKKIREEILANE